MAKGNRESKKPKKEKVKTIAAAPSQKGATAGWHSEVQCKRPLSAPLLGSSWQPLSSSGLQPRGRLMALLGHGATSELSPVSGPKIG